MAVKKNLVIVESPAKAKTIEKILGKKFHVMASFGHVRDLPKSKLGVDVDNNFTPSYSTIKGKGDIIKNLKAYAKKSDKVYLASDPDREGEAIAWHIAHALKLDENEDNRIEFNEITENAIKESIKNPRKIDMDKVNAQQARRILDRLVGYEISPLLWKTISANTSAGRVQSVALKLICDLEDNIKKFIPVKFWDIKGDFEGNLKLNLNKIDGKKVDKVTDENHVKEVRTLEKEKFEITQAKVTKKSKNSPNPLKTSTLQQLASSYIGFSASKTMRVAQGLYEGIDVNGGHIGLITYMRTDSIRISEVAEEMAKEYILKNFGKEYIGVKKASKTKQKIQDAHEAIRPTDINLTPDSLKKHLDNDQYRLYKLIWERFLISQLAPMKYEQFELIASHGKFDFRGVINKIVFDGYYKVFKDEEDLPIGDFPTINVGDKVKLEKLNIKEDYTKPPSRFTESSIVKKLEAEGIGRPSTYAAIIETLKKREYIVLEGKSFIPTSLGYQIKDILESNFPSIMNVKFTAELENELDEVAEGEKDWKQLLSVFYDEIEARIKKYKAKIEEEQNRRIESDMMCTCGKGNMILRSGRFGRYLACPNVDDKENECKEKISLKGVEIDPKEIEAGRIMVKSQVQEILKDKLGRPTDVKTEAGATYLLKTGRFGSYLESEKYSEDNMRMALPTEIRKILAQGGAVEKDGVVQLKELLNKSDVQVEFKEKLTDVKTEDGSVYLLKNGRFGAYLESQNYAKDNLRIPLPSELRKALKDGKIAEFDGVVSLSYELSKIQEAENKILAAAGNCEKCGKPFKINTGRWGKFLSCTGYPKCRNIKKLDADGNIVDGTTAKKTTTKKSTAKKTTTTKKTTTKKTTTKKSTTKKK